MSLLSSLRQGPQPNVAVEIAATHVSGAVLDWRGREPVVSAHAIEPLPPGVLVSSLTTANLHDRPAVAGALRRVLARLGRPRRIGLIVPDLVAKVSIVKFEQVPARANELDELVRWQVRKSAPFAIEEAQVGYVAGQRAPDGQEFIVSLARRDIVEEYERLAADAGAHAGIIDLTTFNVINAVLAGSPASTADWLLVNVTPEYATIVILRGPHLMFFRNRAADTEGTLGDLVHQTAMYYEDRLKGDGFARVILCGGSSGRDAGSGRPVDPMDAMDHVRRSLEQRLATTVQTVDPRTAAALTDRISVGSALLDTLTPLVGLLVRGQVKAA
ncbi:MAG: pilus assembly protein PilM [Vicinamibacterales bacterium]